MKIKSLTNNTGPDVNLELELNELESFTLKVINKLRMWVLVLVSCVSTYCTHYKQNNEHSTL